MDRPAYPPAVHLGSTPSEGGRPRGMGWEPAPNNTTMTSKDTKAPSARALRAYKERVDEHYHFAEGLLPGLHDLYAGAPWFGGSMKRDIQAWCGSLRMASMLRVGTRSTRAQDPDQQLLDALSVLHDTCAEEHLEAVRLLLAADGHPDQWRVRAYQACLQVQGAASELAIEISDETKYHDNFEGLWREATIIGLLYTFQPTMTRYCETGLRYIRQNAVMIDDYDLAKASVAAAEAAQAGADVGLLAAIEEDRAEISSFFELTKPTELVVVPQRPTETGARKDTIKSWGDMLQKPLPLVRRGDIAAHRRSLVERWPHAHRLIDIVLGDLAASETVRFRPTLFVGEPGSGKSSLARAILEEVGLPCELQSLAGVHDAAMMGTSAQWSTARESAPLQVIKRSGMASVGMIWDEVEKVGEGRHNGNALDALLPMLEIDQARRYRDLALEVEVDLSAVSHFGTANSLEGVPAPLRDRMRILHMPTPGWQHLGGLTMQILERIARDRGLDARWYPPLAEDEVDLVRRAWPGGSIRQLTRILTTLLDGRDSLMARC